MLLLYYDRRRWCIIDAKTLKEKLNPELIEKILIELGCHSVKRQGKYIKAANPDGDNSTAITVKIDEEKHWSTHNFTRPIFEGQQFKDIISLTEFLENISFPKAIKKICSICGFDYYYDPIDDTPAFLQWLDFIEKGCKSETEEDKIKPLPEIILQQYTNIPPKKWVNEDISYEALLEWNIGVDNFSERIVLPIRDEIGNIVGIKGRLLDDSKIDNDKYIYLYPCSKSKMLFGLDKTYEYIKEKDECIVVEGAKSVIKLWSHGIRNVVSIEGKVLSPRQCELLLRTGVKKILLALDKGVTDEEIGLITKDLKYPVETSEVWVLKDEFGFLDNKESPSDKIENFKLLYESFQYKL